jgi:chromosome segregation ATPase
MEFEEIIKKVQWLDDQQRKSKTEVSELSNRLTGLTTNINAVAQQLKGISQQVNDLSVAAARIEQFDQILAKHRVEVAKSIETIEKNATRREQEATKAHQAEMEEFRKIIFDLRTAVAAEQTARKDRTHEDQRRVMTLQDMGTAVEAAVRLSKEIQEAHKGMEEARRQDAKRFTDLQAELASVRKRAEDAREKSALHGDSIRNVENRINELMETESTRQERHAALLQQQALQQVERDRAWKEWQEKYESFKAQAGSAESQVAAFEDAIRAAQQAQEAYDGLNQRLERRIAETGEIQRLADERIRQEWIAFKADEQKRWTGHTLAQDDSIRDLRKDVDKIEKRVAAIDDTAQTMQDQLQQTTDTTEKQLQELTNVSHDWLSAYERIMGHSKTKAKKAVR